jgi:hypothetical protein
MSQQEQLREAINMLRGYRDPERAVNRDLFYDLLVAIYGPQWGAPRMDYLKEVLSAVRLPRDYFLSFTTRHSSQIVVNPINSRYLYFIKKVLRDRFKTVDEENHNLFARAIHEIFSEKAERGYYFPKSEDDTSIVDEELKKELNQSMVFVQIVQQEVFTLIKKNYCFLEWGWARHHFGSDERRVLYILGEEDRDLLENYVPDATYNDWHLHVKAKKDNPPPTQTHRLPNDEKIEETRCFFETLRKRVIVGAWTRLEIEAP